MAMAMTMVTSNPSTMAAQTRSASLPVGYCFCPSDDEIILHFLYKKIKGTLQDCNEITDCDIYGDTAEPLINDSDTAVMYFFTQLKKKGTEKGKRWDRVTKSGTWKTQRDDPIYWRRKGKGHIGSKRSFKFIPKNKQDPRIRGWIMHEFRVDGQLLQHIKESENKDYVVCRIKKDRETKKMMKNSSSSCINNHDQQQTCNDGNVGQIFDQQAAATTTTLLDDPDQMWVKLQEIEQMLLNEKAPAVEYQDGGAITSTSVLQNMEFGQAPLACNYYGDQHSMQQQQQKSCNDDHHHDHDDNAAAGTALDDPEMWVKLQEIEQYMLLDEKATAVLDQDGGATPTSVLQNMEFGQAPDLACNNYNGDQHMQQQMDLNPNYMEEQEAAAGQTSNYQEMMMMVDSTAADEEQLVFNNDHVYTPCLAKEDDMAAGAAPYNDGQQDNTILFSLEEMDILGKLLF